LRNHVSSCITVKLYGILQPPVIKPDKILRSCFTQLGFNLVSDPTDYVSVKKLIDAVIDLMKVKTFLLWDKPPTRKGGRILNIRKGLIKF